MAHYNPSQLQESVARLQSKARSVALLYGVVGVGAGIVAGQYLDGLIGVAGMGLLAPLLLGVGFYALGRERAFHLSLEAQNTLCRLRLAEAIRELLMASKRTSFVDTPAAGGVSGGAATAE